MNRCFAYREDGRICGAPAVAVDAQRGFYVCAAHQIDRPQAQMSAGVSRDDSDPRSSASSANNVHWPMDGTGLAEMGE